MRCTGPTGAPAVVCVNGGQEAPVEGTWSASLEWLVLRLAPRFAGLRFCEVRYRVKSWRELGSCVEDARAAVREAAGPRTLLLGFSLGGAVAVSAADEPSVRAVVGLAPWLPDRLDLRPLRGRALTVLHGTLDRPFFGLPAVSPSLSRAAFDRARRLGVDGRYVLVPGGLHGVAVRARGSTPIPLPRARVWARHVADELDAFARAD